MKRFIAVISVFIGILAYNMYTPTREECHQKWGHDFGNTVRDGEIKAGLVVAVFFGGATCYGLFGLHGHFDRKRSRG